MTLVDWRAPVTLEGRVVRLEPLSRDHLDGLSAVGLAPEIWRWMPVVVGTPEDVAELVEAAIARAGDGLEVPFATVEQASGRPIGSTRFLAIEPAHRRLEIGWTWLAPAWQHTAANSEAKLLMLGHAFDALGALRVEFKTDALNEPSRRALAKIGAIEEGTLRRHMLVQGGHRRDSVYFSVIKEEWPQVRAALEARVARLTSS